MVGRTVKLWFQWNYHRETNLIHLPCHFKGFIPFPARTVVVVLLGGYFFNFNPISSGPFSHLTLPSHECNLDFTHSAYISFHGVTCTFLNISLLLLPRTPTQQSWLLLFLFFFLLLLFVFWSPSAAAQLPPTRYSVDSRI